MTKQNKISEEVREDAAVLCAAMADWWAYPSAILRPPRVGWDGTDALDVAVFAFRAVAGVVQVDHDVAYREAEALLRDGWCPGDPVYLRKVSP